MVFCVPAFSGESPAGRSSGSLITAGAAPSGKISGNPASGSPDRASMTMTAQPEAAVPGLPNEAPSAKPQVTTPGALPETVVGQPQVMVPGGIRGQVLDESTEAPLPGAMVLVEGTALGASADADGRYRIPSVPPGIYNVRFVMMGFETRIVNTVVVNPGRTTGQTILMKSTLLEHEGVDVTAGYFHDAKDAVVSNRSMDYEEIRMDAGSAEDIQRVVQALPAVVSGGDQENEIIVRGGMYGENLFVMDNIEIPNPNHFAFQGAGGGPVNMINDQFVRQADFYAGAFPARYGDKASSVLDISLRDGDRKRRTGHATLGMSGAGLMAEGPIAGGRGSYILSGRKSFLDLIISATGLTAVPKYYNLQGKITYDLDGNNQILVNGIFGDDRIHIRDDEEDSAYNQGTDDVVSNGHQYAAGATWKHLFGDRGYSKLTLSQTLNHWDQTVRYGGGKLFTNLSTEIERALRFEATIQPSRALEFNFGGSLKAIPLDLAVHDDADTVFEWNTKTNPPGIVRPFVTYPVYDRENKTATSKAAAFAQVKVHPVRRLTVNLGLRGDYFEYTRRHAVDPRLGFSYALTGKSNLNLAFGRHSQAPAYVDMSRHPDNRDLEYKQTTQTVAGLEHLFRDDIKGTVEVFYKDYRHVPISLAALTADPYDGGEGRLVGRGRGHAKGIEFFLQKKMSRRFHATVSYSYSVSRGVDPRSGEGFDWDFDFRHVFTAIGGVQWDLREKSWYQRLNRKAWYKWIDWILPFGDQVEAAVRWRYLGGRPYSRQTYEPQYRSWVVEPDTPMNGERFPAYHRLDFRLDRRYMFNGWNLVTYFDIMNVYSRDNIWDYSYNDDGTREDILQYKVFPVGGVTVEF
jgi:hypothetical protein